MNPFTPLKILYQDQRLVAVDKPSGLHVHPTQLDPGERSCQQILRDQIGQWVWPVHRLDRGTSGVQLFALDRETNSLVSSQFSLHTVTKFYRAIVRGFIPEEGEIDHPIRDSSDKASPAVTHFTCLARAELPIPLGQFQTVRYSLAEARPITGRQHQLRRHFRHISHQIIGDTTYGDSAHNSLFREHFGSNRLLLFAVSLRFRHPETGELKEVGCEPPENERLLFERLGWGEFCGPR